MSKNKFLRRNCRLCGNHNIIAPKFHLCPFEVDHKCLACYKVLRKRAAICKNTRKCRNRERENDCFKCILHLKPSKPLHSIEQKCPFASCLCYLCKPTDLMNNSDMVNCVMFENFISSDKFLRNINVEEAFVFKDEFDISNYLEDFSTAQDFNTKCDISNLFDSTQSNADNEIMNQIQKFSSHVINKAEYSEDKFTFNYNQSSDSNYSSIFNHLEQSEISIKNCIDSEVCMSMSSCQFII